MNKSIDPRWGDIHRLHDARILAGFKARSTDVLITTAPKCGTTWMQQILHQLRSGGDSTFETIDDVVPWLEIQRAGYDAAQINTRFENMPNPRIFKTHCTYQQTPGAGIARIVLSSRDPRDACVSFYHHQMNMTDAACKSFNMVRPKNFDEYFKSWMAYAAWYRNVSSWWPHINDKNLLWLRYEDMKRDLAKTIDQLLNFLAWKLEEQQKTRILEYCSFQWMKDHSDKFTHRDAEGKLTFKPKCFIRKGRVGDYKTQLSAKQEQEILDKAYDVLPAECIQFLGLNDFPARTTN